MKVQQQWLEAVRAAITAASAQRALYDKDVTWARHWRQFCTLGIDGPRGVGTSTAIIMAAGASDLVVVETHKQCQHLRGLWEDVRAGPLADLVSLRRNDIIQKDFLQRATIGRKFNNIWFERCEMDDNTVSHLGYLFGRNSIEGIAIFTGREPLLGGKK